jgi:hypothetical protein
MLGGRTDPTPYMMVKDIASWTPCLVGTKGYNVVTTTVEVTSAVKGGPGETTKMKRAVPSKEEEARSVAMVEGVRVHVELH